MKKLLCVIAVIIFAINIGGCVENVNTSKNLAFSGVVVEVENEMPCTVESYNDWGTLVEAYKVLRVNISGKENYVTKNSDIGFYFDVEELYAIEGSGYCELWYQLFDEEGNLYKAEKSSYASSGNRLKEGEKGITKSLLGFRDVKNGKYKLKIIERP